MKHSNRTNLLDNQPIARKVWATLLLVIISLAGGASWVQSRTAQVSAHALETVLAHEERIHDATTWKGMSDATFQRVLATALSREPAITQTFGPGIKDGIAAISVLQKKIASEATSDADKAALAVVAERRKALLAATKALEQMRESGAPMADMQAFVDSDLTSNVKPYMAALDDFVKLQDSERDEAARVAAAEVSQLSTLGLIGLAAVAALGLATALVIVRSIQRPLREAVALSKAIAGGDLALDLRSDRADELGELMRAMGAMATQLRSVVADVRDGVETVSTASAQIATGGADLSQRTEEQASNLQQTAASMEELTATVLQNSDNARAAAQLAKQASSVAEQGGEVVGQVTVTRGGTRRRARPRIRGGGRRSSLSGAA